MMGNIAQVLLQISDLFRKCNNEKNRLKFDKVRAESECTGFSLVVSSVYSVLS